VEKGRRKSKKKDEMENCVVEKYEDVTERGGSPRGKREEVS
jgi:hypothetical protein